MSEARPVIIGLLGGVASGKSSVARILARQGAQVLDADQLAAAALQEPDLRQEVEQRFGPTVRSGDQIDRKALGQAVFGDPEGLRWLEGRLHPLVRARIREDLNQHIKQAAVPAVVLDIPLLLESSPFREDCDLLLFVDSPLELRQQHGASRHGWSADEIERRESQQISPATKRDLADVVLPNAGSEEQLRQTVEDWLVNAGGFQGLPRRS
jgi:dephospho-CoA kinase